MTPSRAIFILERRRTFLLTRLAASHGGQADFVDMEIKALSLAIQLLRTTPT